MKLIFKILFLIAGIVFCIAVSIDNDLIRTIAKPIPLLSLLFITPRKSSYNKLIFFGFIFSLFGDIFLLKVLDLFIFGLASFLIAHIFYIAAFKGRFSKINLLSSIPFYIIAAALAYWFYPYLNVPDFKDMMIPVFIYIFVIMTMVWRAYLQKKHNKFAMLAFIGAFLFAVSDTNIAFTKFVTDYELSKIVTIVLYWSAQYLIFLSTKKA